MEVGRESVGSSAAAAAVSTAATVSTTARCVSTICTTASVSVGSSSSVAETAAVWLLERLRRDHPPTHRRDDHWHYCRVTQVDELLTSTGPHRDTCPTTTPG